MRARGFDVSHYQLAHLMCWLAWKALGFCFAWVRLSIGLQRDAQAQGHTALLRAAGYLFGPYHALHEGANPREQARFFLDLIEALMPDGQLPAMLDVERLGLREWHVTEFLHEWGRITTREIGIYTSANTWHRIVGRGMRLWARKLKVWLAGYPHDRSDYDTQGNWQGQLMDPASVARRSNPPADGWALIPDPWLPLPGHDPVFPRGVWQHTGHGRLDGYAKDLDINVFDGTEADLRAWLGLSAPLPAQILAAADVILGKVAALRELVARHA
jgi:lysozyme